MAEPQSQLSVSDTPSSEKDGIKTETETETENRDAEEAAEAEYPQGISLILIVVAVVLAIFLISLDQVPTLPQPHTLYTNFTRPFSAPQSPKSQTNSAVWIRYHGSARHTS
jgi:uncharacterized protein HemX